MSGRDLCSYGMNELELNMKCCYFKCICFQIMTTNKSSYTFCLKDGVDYEFEVEPVYINTKTQLVEPLSASSRTTPRDKKRPFGPVKKVTMIDEQVIKIENETGDEVFLEVQKLAPLIDKEDSRLKKELINLQAKDTNVLAKTLNDLISKMHGEKFKKNMSVNLLKRQSTLPSTEQSYEGQGETSSSCGGERMSVHLSGGGSRYSLRSSQKFKKQKTENVEEENKACGEVATEDGVDMVEYCEQVILRVQYKSIDSDKIQVPSCLRIDHAKVAELKNLLVSRPDKTQTFCRLVCVRDEEKEDEDDGSYWVYVNVEMFIAMKELAYEGRANKRILAVVHFVNQDDPVSDETFGIFLNTNSKEFSARLHEQLTYQDILRFCISTLTNESDKKVEEVKNFLKRTLKGFSKGSQNISTFLNFGVLDIDYLNLFETFLHLFETGGLVGQKLSTRKMMNVDKKGRKRKDCRIEVPIGLIKMHLKVPQKTRENLLSSLLNKKIEFSVYRQKIMNAASVSDRMKQIEDISKKPFEEVKKTAPELFTDETLLEFAGAKNSPAGPNKKLEKLVEHVKAALGEASQKESEESHFIASDSLNIHSLGRLLKDFNVVIINLKEESGAEDFCLTEKIKDDKNCVGIIIKSETALRAQMSGTFDVEDDIIVSFVYVKMEKPAQEDGIMKEITPIAIFGHKDYFKNKDLKNFYNFPLKQALQFILKDLVATKERVLYTFSESGRFEVDVLGSLKRKGVQVSYMAVQDVLTEIEDVIGKNIVGT